MNRHLLFNELKIDEGYKQFPYRCSGNKLTIGYGRNIEDNGISKLEADYLLWNDINIAISEIKDIFIDFDNYPELVQRALTNMIFNLGKNKFLEFKKMIEAIRQHDWIIASNEAKDSKWHNQVKERAIRIEKMLSNIE